LFGASGSGGIFTFHERSNARTAAQVPKTMDGRLPGVDRVTGDRSARDEPNEAGARADRAPAGWEGRRTGACAGDPPLGAFSRSTSVRPCNGARCPRLLFPHQTRIPPRERCLRNSRQGRGACSNALGSKDECVRMPLQQLGR
jgi:hypothetical protein